MQIRPATLADVTSMIRLDRQSATAGHWTEDQYLQALQSESTRRLVFVIDEPSAPEAPTRVQAFLVAQHIPPEWELENIVVAATARRKGLGTRLLQHLLSTPANQTATLCFWRCASQTGPRELCMNKQVSLRPGAASPTTQTLKKMRFSTANPALAPFSY